MVGQVSCGEAWCASFLGTTLLSVSIPSAILLASVPSRRTIAAATSGLWDCWVSERAGTTITTLFHAQLSMGSTGGSSISLVTSFGYLNASAWLMRCIASRLLCSYAIPLVMEVPCLARLTVGLK